MCNPVLLGISTIKPHFSCHNIVMPRVARVSVGGMVYHVINRSNGRVQIFDSDAEYRHFETILQEGVDLIGMRILAF